MKKLIIPIGVLLVTGHIKAQVTPLPNTENYIQTKSYLNYTGTQATKTSEIIQYFDGLGRPKQVVGVKTSPQGKDVVTHIEYDAFGRQVKDYLPVPQSGTQNGAIYTSPLGNAPSVYGSEKIFSQKVLENSPLDRIQQQIQTGTDWSTKPVNFGYAANGVNEVYQYVTSTIWENGATKSVLSLAPNTTYAPNQLYKNTVKDEDGNETIEFKNGVGQTLLVRKVLNANVHVDTYYVYNEYNQLAFVLSPNAVNKPITDDLLNNFCYQYRYDGKNRLVEKRLPGKGWEYMVYDKADRLVLTQDGKLRSQGKWLFTKYDQFSRPVYTGILDSPPGRAQQVVAVEGAGLNNESRNTSSWNNSGMDVFYTNSGAYPTTNFKLSSVYYYDTYPGYSFNPAFPSTILGETVLKDVSVSNGRSTKGLPLLDLVKNVENDNWTKDYLYYDNKARVIGTYSINYLGGYTQTESKLDFVGISQTIITKHKRTITEPERVITETFEYDSQNRLKKQWHQVDANPQELLADNTYNELSQLSNKKVGNNLQSIDYAYNVRGWMTKINDPSNLNGKLFGYELKYNTPLEIEQKYNGNIAEVDWKTSVDNTLKRYDYRYDALNRLTQAYYREPLSAVPQNNFYNEQIAYDNNGNITNLLRNSKNSSNTTELIDNLTYNYSGNKLTSISDASQNYSGYPYFQSPNTIVYDNDNSDGNGNMISHIDKNIKSIDYNFLNLPNLFKSNTTGSFANSTAYLYRSDGVKLKKTYAFSERGDFGTISYAVKTTDYLDGFQYSLKSTGVGCIGCPDPIPDLQFVPTSEGYFDFTKNKYIYNYTDHLGNIRLSYMNNGSGAQAIEENNFYPFGLKHGTASAANPNYQYKYNGKELQETGMYDYGARMYMPEIGRWGVIDPLAEKYVNSSPYIYAGNNPVIFIDPNGAEIVNGETENRKKLEKDFKQRESILNSQYGGNKNLTKKDFASKSDFNKYQTVLNGLNESQAKLDKSLEIEKGIQSVIDEFKNVDPDNFKLADNLQYKDADGNSHKIDVVVKSGEASAFGGAFTATAFTSTPEKGGGSKYFGIHSITTTIDLKKIFSLSGAFAHEMGHAYNISMNPSQARDQGAGDSGTINCQDPKNRNTFQSKTAMDWQENFMMKQIMRFQFINLR